MLRKGAPDSDLRAWGLGKQQSGGKGAKRRAVARKLAVLLHRLWANGEVYDPLYNRKAVKAAKAKGKTKAKVGHRKRRIGFCLYAEAPSWGDCEVAADRGEPGDWFCTDRYRDGSTPEFRTPMGTAAKAEQSADGSMATVALKSTGRR